MPLEPIPAGPYVYVGKVVGAQCQAWADGHDVDCELELPEDRHLRDPGDVLRFHVRIKAWKRGAKLPDLDEVRVPKIRQSNGPSPAPRKPRALAAKEFGRSRLRILL